MTDPQHPLDYIAAKYPQRAFDHDQRAEGREPYPLSATTLHGDDYNAERDRIMAIIGPLLAEAAALSFSWAPDARPCPHMRSNDPCHNDQPHKGGPDGLGCVHWGSTWDDGHDVSERRATA